MKTFILKSIIGASQYVKLSAKTLPVAAAVLGLSIVAMHGEAKADPYCWMVPGLGIVCF